MNAPADEPTPAGICAIVITYNPDNASLDCIQTIAAAAVHTVIVDNRSSEPCVQKLRELSSEKVSLVENTSNTGVAAGLNLGIRTGAGKGYSWFLLFDQDTRIFPNTIQNLVQIHADCFSALGPKLGLLGCGYHNKLHDGTVVDAAVPLSEGRLWLAKEFIITSGTLLSLEIFKTIGPFREDFFVDHVDHDYCLRARRKGFILACTTLPLMIHRLGILRTKRLWPVFGPKKVLSFYSPLRRYYQLRNFLFLARDYGDEFPQSIHFIRDLVRREIRLALKYDDHFLRNLTAVILAVRHSKHGIAGKYSGRIL
ncbi:MAG: glycosyltransferase [Patescibacteria group bacterium]|nr:glycosyltransferase [Patescibacteria group bacterium]